MTEKQLEYGLKSLNEEFGEDRVNKAINAIEKFKVEVPSWVFGEFGGGRFGGYMPPGFARDINEKLDDAAFVNKLTGAVEGIATHILWDYSLDGLTGSFEIARQVANEANKRGLKLGSINPTYFLKGSHRGSLSAEESNTREKYVEQTILSVKIAGELANGIVAIWVPDGSNYPGQIELKKAYNNTKQSLKEVASEIVKINKNSNKKVKALIEYKVFEPGTYSTVLSDWGSAYLIAKEFDGNAGVLIDMGHHHHSTNVEQIVARLLNEGIYGGFHFNTRYAADDDHAVEPNPEMARIFYELISGGGIFGKNNWALMIDQCSSREKRIPAILHSIDSLQLSLAKAMLVDQKLLSAYQKNDEIILANRVFNNAIMNADVRPIVAKARLNKSLSLDPVKEYSKSGYQEKIELLRAEELIVQFPQY
ncbi:MAG: L-rhamnose isomerase [Bacteroidetes bacterium]|nr:L-rhamnose isomerase [Bacteroidota bacterium]